MRFSTAAAAFGLFAFTSAQTTRPFNTTSVASSTSAISAAPTPLTAEQQCLKACAPADICCQAACVNVPCPSALQANQTTECAAKCPQGNGTKDETASYASCQASCVSSYFLSTTAAGAGATGTSGGAGSAATTTAAGSGAGSSSVVGIGGTASATGSGAKASSTGNAASNIKTQIAGAGLFGLIIAGLAL